MMTQRTASIWQEQRLLQEISQVQVALESMKSIRGQDSGCQGDSGDQANRVVELQIDLRHQRYLQQKLSELKRAHAKLSVSHYGFCESCGEPIDPARLDIIPHAAMCVGCQREIERRTWSQAVA